jgi:hypothetical protein
LAKVETVRKSNLGTTELRLVKNASWFHGLADGKPIVEGEDADDVWRRLHDEAAKKNPKYFGYDDARIRFLSYFPGGFYSTEYESAERNYKLDAKTRLDSEAPVDRAAEEGGFGEAVLSVFQDTNLLSRFEKPRLTEALRGPSADAFIRGAALFALGDLKNGLLTMQRALKPHRVANWAAVTYLPFLWRPEQHMFLKPEVTQDFAARVGHRFAFDYASDLDVAVYGSLLDLIARTTAELAELRPRDRIDVQSFIWVIGGYKRQPGEPSRNK